MYKLSTLTAVIGTAALFGASQASAGLAHEYNFDLDGSDSVGSAPLDINGGATVSGGNLMLPGGGIRVNNAAASGTSLSTLAGTINGTDALSIVVRYNTTVAQDWSKAVMAGDPAGGGDPALSYIDITPQRGGGQGQGATFNDSLGGEAGVNGLPVIAPGTDAFVVGIWDEATDSITVYVAEDGNLASLVSGTGSMGGKDLANLPINEFYVGSAVNFGDQDFNGTIDQVQIYDHALTLGEVQTLVPEPSSLALLGLGGLFVARRRRSA